MYSATLGANEPLFTTCTNMVQVVKDQRIILSNSTSKQFKPQFKQLQCWLITVGIIGLLIAVRNKLL
jgi:hypothetical protein